MLYCTLCVQFFMYTVQDLRGSEALRMSIVQQQDGLYLVYRGIIVYTVHDLRGSEALRMSNNKMDCTLGTWVSLCTLYRT